MYVPLDILATLLGLASLAVSLSVLRFGRRQDLVSQKDLKDVRSDMKRIELEWDDVYEKLRQLTGRLTKREEREQRKVPQGGRQTGNGERTQYVEDLLTSRPGEEVIG